MRITPIEFLLENLEQAFPKDSLSYIPQEQAYEELKEVTGVDFGYDVMQWKQWLKNRKKGETNSDPYSKSG
ncbi:MAG: hypothetical protein RBT80_24675 [Candidatus Vecturithrix sp.]|jgi:hypothetical protein|nr:hypothetical protein [Candidatus Vecturithrix sp.]